MGTTRHRPWRPARLSGALALWALAGGCSSVDTLLCQDGNCGWSSQETASLMALADLPEAPPPDTSNKFNGNPAAEQLGRQFFSDPRFSGFSTGADEIGRPVPFGRAAKNQPLNISCFTCHELRRGGADVGTIPGNVSLGAKWTNTNTSSVINSAYQPFLFWANRADSLWAQPPGSIENSMGSNRLRAAWTIATYYKAAYETIFVDYPLPLAGTLASVSATLATDAGHAGQCQLTPDCPADCRLVMNDTFTASGCWPRFPLDGKPGSHAGCQPGDPTEPFGDAWDCMAPDDRTAILRVIVNFAKAIGAFEMRLVSRDSAFDRFVADLRDGRANESTVISAEAKNGARLFVGKAGCTDCHNTPLLSDGKVYNVGVPDIGEGVPSELDCPKGGVCDCVTPNNCLPWGARDGIVKLQKHAYLRTSVWSDNPGDDSRQAYLALAPESIAKGSYRTAALRDVALTAPYMHDGVFATLEEVVAHYNRGGDPTVGGDRAARIKPLHLTAQEQNELVAFLKTLTGAPLPSNLADPPELPR